MKGIIVETECYPGGDDKASQSFGGKKTERNAPMYMSPGTAYVYLTYGMYFCFNISSQGKRQFRFPFSSNNFSSVLFQVCNRY